MVEDAAQEGEAWLYQHRLAAVHERNRVRRISHDDSCANAVRIPARPPSALFLSLIVGLQATASATGHSHVTQVSISLAIGPPPLAHMAREIAKTLRTLQDMRLFTERGTRVQIGSEITTRAAEQIANIIAERCEEQS